MEESKPKKRKGCLIPIICLAVIFVALCVVVGVGANKDSNSKETNMQSELAKTMGLSEEQESAVLDIFASCGIGEIKSVSLFKSGERESSYHVDDVETVHYKGADNTIVVWVDNNTKTVKRIYFHDQDIYVDGAAVGNISDYYVPASLRDEYRVESQLLVKNVLNQPDTAKFGAISKWAFGVSDDGFDLVQSEVTAKNALGADVTERFQVKFERATKKPVSLIVGDTEYLK